MTLARLRLEFLGTFRVTLEGDPAPRFRSSKAKALLVYLAIESEREHPRERLATLFWPEKETARALHNLREVLRTLRKALGGSQVADQFIRVTRESVQFRREASYWLDVEAFLSLIAGSSSANQRDVETLEKAVDLYKGDLLENVILVGNSAIWDDWLRVQREHLHRLMVRTLLELADYYESIGHMEKAEQYLRRLIHMEPWNEEAHRRLMLILALVGRRQDALAQYQQCYAVLKRELSLEPGKEIRQLYDEIRRGRIPSRVRETLTVSSTTRGEMPVFFVGRQEELKHLATYLSKPECRLVTITGLGGIGKSTLAREVARMYGGMFRDNVTFISLQSIDSPNLVPQAVAQALGILWEPRDVKNRVLQYLAGKEMLLILDNFEHVLEAREFVNEILQRAPHVKILITSLEPLGLYQEWLFHLKGLSYPSRATVSNPMDYDAIRWFVQSARRLIPHFTLTPKDIPWVVRICKYVHGSPLGILLATTWLSSATLQDIAASIEHDPDLLQAELLDLPPRHRSMRSVFEYTWQWLSPQEQTVFRRLGVFQGGFSRKLAEDVARADLSTLARLVARSLVSVEQPGRYILHPLLRRFARVKLAQDPEEERAVYRQYARYVLHELAKQSEPLRGREMRRAIDVILSFLPEVRAAWRWAAEHGPVEWLHEALDALSLFYIMHGPWDAGENLFAETLILLKKRPDRASPEVQRLYGRVLTDRAWILSHLSRMVEASEALREASDYLQTHGTPEDVAHSDYVWGLVYNGMSDYKRAEASFQKARRFYEQEYHPYELALTYIHLAHTWDTMSGDSGHPLVLYKEALHIFRELQHPLGIALALNSIATCEYNLGHYEVARQAYEESLRIKKNIGDDLGKAMTLNNLGSIALMLHQPQKAHSFFQQSIELYEKIGSQWGVAYVSLNIGDLALSQGRADVAIQHFMRALHIYRQLSHRWGIALALRYLAKFYTVQGRWERAREALLEAVDIVSRLKAVPLSLFVLTSTGLFLLYRGRIEKGMLLLQFVYEHKASTHELRTEIEGLVASAPVPISADVKYRAWQKAQQMTMEALHQSAYTWLLAEETT